MPVQVSDTIAVGDSTAFVPTLPRVSKVGVSVVFYTDAAGLLAQASAIGTGTRTITVSRIDYVEGGAGEKTMPITGAAVTDQPARTWKTLDLGPLTPAISIVCSGGTDPAASTHYRIWVDG